MMDKKIKILIIVISASFLLNLLINLTNHISGDGCWHMAAAKFISKNGKLPSFEYIGRTEPFWPPPLFHIINGVLYKIGGLLKFNDLLVRFTLPIASLFCLIFLFLIAKKLYNINIALYSIFFLAFIPIFIDYSSNYHVEVFLTFFILGSIYFILEDKIFLAGLFFGFSLLSKFNTPFAIFGLLYLLYIKYKFNLKKYLIFISASSIGILAYLRSYILFENPVWPALTSIFDGIIVPGMENTSILVISLNNIFQTKTIPSEFLGLFGIPGGNLKNLSFIKIPLINVLLAIYLMIGIIYLIPVLFLFNKKFIKKNIYKKEIFLIIWILGFLLFERVYRFPEMRLLIPIIPAIAIFWAIGINNIINKIRARYKITLLIFLILINISFIGIIITKSRIASKEWSKYNEDYYWIKLNIPENALFYTNGQCLTINTDRYSRFLPLNEEDYKKIKKGYFFFNNEFNIEPQVKLSDEKQEFIQEVTNCTIVYSNPKTKTEICKI